MSAEKSAPEFDLWGETRVRYETLDGQFRSGRTGGDQVLAIRSLLAGSVGWEGFKVVGELHDARAYLDDLGTPLSTSLVNTVDVLQAYLALGNEEGSQIKVGRFTLDIASRRFVERNDFRNTINAYTGFHWTQRSGQSQLDAFCRSTRSQASKVNAGVDRQ